MPIATVLYGPSFASLRRRAFSRAAADASSRPGSVLLFETNDTIRDAHITAWSSDPNQNALQLNSEGLASFVAKAHDRFVDPVPDIGTLERQRTIEQALEEVEMIHDARRYANQFSELFRELEAHGLLTPDAVTGELTSSDLNPRSVEVISGVFERYYELLDEFAHPHALTRSRKFLNVANVSGSLTEAFPEIDHVIVSGYVNPSPVEVAVLERIADEFPTTIILPTVSRQESSSDASDWPEPLGPDSVLSATLAAYEPIDIQTEYVPTASEALTRTIAGRLYTVAATEDPVDATEACSWHEAPTPDREVRHLARHLRDQLAKPDVTPEDILVLSPGLLSYRDRIDDIFPEYEVPHVASVSILLERTYAGRAILDAVALCTGPDTDQLARLATNPAVTLDGVDTAELTSLVQRLPSSDVDSLSEHASKTLREGLEEVLDRAAAVRRADGIETLRSFGLFLDFLCLRSNVEALESEDVDGFDGDEPFSVAHAVRTARADEREIAIGYEEQAIRRVHHILTSLVPVLERGEKDSVVELESALQGVRVPPPKQAEEGRVRVVGLQDVPMAGYCHLYVLGATRDNLPGDPDRPRYFQSVGDAIDLLPENRARDLARYRFGLALANAETVHVTTPAQTIGGEDILPSPMLDELSSVAEIDRSEGVEGEPRGSREDIQRSLAGAGPDQLDASLESAASDGIFSPAQLDAMRAGATTCANRAEPGPTTYDAHLDAETLRRVGEDLTKTPYSPSRLNKYAKCGFKYYLDNGLDLSKPDELSPDAGRFAVGDVVHKALEFFYEELLNESDGPVILTEYDRIDLERELLAAGQRAIETVDDTFESPFDRQRLRGIFAGLATPSDNEFYEHLRGPGGGERDEEQADVNGFLVRVLDRELSDHGGHPRFVEEWFGGQDIPVSLNDGTPVPVHGVIDRVDIARTDDGGLTIRVIDYKTYRKDATDAVRGIDFQLPAYLLGARAIVEAELGETPDEVDGEYRVLKPPGTVSSPASLGQRVEWDLEADVDDFLEEIVPEWIERAVSGIGSGAFQPAVVGPDAAGCHNCDYATVCDVRHHRRFEAIERIDEDDQPVYIPAGARHGELMDQVSIGQSGGGDR